MNRICLLLVILLYVLPVGLFSATQTIEYGSTYFDDGVYGDGTVPWFGGIEYNFGSNTVYLEQIQTAWSGVESNMTWQVVQFGASEPTFNVIGTLSGTFNIESGQQATIKTITVDDSTPITGRVVFLLGTPSGNYMSIDGDTHTGMGDWMYWKGDWYTDYDTFVWFIRAIVNDTPPTANVTFTNGSGFTPSVTPGSTNQPLGRFYLTADASGSSLTDATIRLNGTRTGLSNFKLWASANATFGSDTQIGSTVGGDPGDGNSVSFTGFSSSITTGDNYYFLTADVAGGATGAVQGIIVNNASLTLNGGTLSGSISNALLSSGDASLPVELLAFTARMENARVLLVWRTASEVENLGFTLERQAKGTTGWELVASFQTHETLQGRGSAQTGADYTFMDETAIDGETYRYRLSDVAVNGSKTNLGSVDITVDTSLPDAMALLPVYPNPFNPETQITYELSKDAQVTLTVYNATGQIAINLYHGWQPAGTHSYAWAPSSLPSGVYFVRLNADGVNKVKKCLLLK